jgi:hypothetical protein
VIWPVWFDKRRKEKRFVMKLLRSNSIVGIFSLAAILGSSYSFAADIKVELNGSKPTLLLDYKLGEQIFASFEENHPDEMITEEEGDGRGVSRIKVGNIECEQIFFDPIFPAFSYPDCKVVLSSPHQEPTQISPDTARKVSFHGNSAAIAFEFLKKVYPHNIDSSQLDSFGSGTVVVSVENIRCKMTDYQSCVAPKPEFECTIHLP